MLNPIGEDYVLKIVVENDRIAHHPPHFELIFKTPEEVTKRKEARLLPSHPHSFEIITFTFHIKLLFA